ncbi:MAG TPA: Ig-like domain-containing protein, partial [Verrucomicrobiae bacterium]|nr:Ig-like domain-containing protein [Verrucomicrobiae bacterium]
KTSVLILALCAWFGASTVQAQLIGYEPFNYPTGAFLNGTACTGTGFTGNWTLSGPATIIGGLTYPSLPTTDNAFQQSPAGQRDSVSLSTPLSSGTVYISFLYNQAGNNGGNANGLYLSGSGATSLYVGLTAPWSGTAGELGLGTIATSSAGATGLSSVLAQMPGPTQLMNYNQTNLIVLRIDFNTSGTNDTVSLWLNPTADVTAPEGNINAPNPDLVYSNYDAGTISGIGFNFQGGGAAEQYDEIRIGASYGSVVGASAGATIPTTLALSVAPGKEVSWTANGTDSYQPQSSSDGINWNNLGGILTGNAVTSVFDSSPSAFYQVLDYTVGGIGNAATNGSFEIPDVNSTGALGWSGPANGIDVNGNYIGVYVTNSWGTLTPVDGTNLMYMEGATPATGPVTPPNVYLQSAPFPIPTGGVTYPLSFSSANPVTIGGANPQYQVEFWDVNQDFISATAFYSIGAGANWTTISNNIPAPAKAAFMSINFIEAVGAGNGWDWVTLIDNIQVDYEIPGPTNVLAATVQAGAVFTATVETNGVTATAATGSVAFETNSVAESAGIVNSGIANGSPTGVPASYTITAIYSGDGTYLGSTNTLVVGGGNFGSGTATVNLARGQTTVVFSGIPGNIYSLQRATNVMFTAGISNFPAVTAPPGGNVSNIDNFSDLGVVPNTAFYRLRYIP